MSCAMSLAVKWRLRAYDGSSPSAPEVFVGAVGTSGVTPGKLFPRSKAWNGARQRDGKLSEKFRSAPGSNVTGIAPASSVSQSRNVSAALPVGQSTARTQRGHVVAPRKSPIRLERFQQKLIEHDDR